jgi:hypothetical protein
MTIDDSYDGRRKEDSYDERRKEEGKQTKTKQATKTKQYINSIITIQQQ